MHTLKDVLNPLHPKGHYALPHGIAVVLAAIVKVILVVMAVLATQAAIAHFQHRYTPALLHNAPPPGPRLVARTTALPSAAHIWFRYFHTGINDQGSVGACQAWSFAKQASYAYNWNGPVHHSVFFSPRCPYDDVSQGVDGGSYIDQYPGVVHDIGLVPFAQVPYGSLAPTVLGLPAYAVDWPIPLQCAHGTVTLPGLSEQILFEGSQSGQGGVDMIRQEIATHHAVNIGVPVYSSFWASSATGHVDLPAPGEALDGYHAMTIVRYDDNHVYNGVQGWALASNQWGWDYGVNRDGVRSTTNGYVWLSYRFLAQYGFAAAVIHIPRSEGLKAVHHIPFWPSDVRTHKAPKIPTHRGLRVAGGNWVTGVVTRDTGVNITGEINDAAAFNGISAVGLTSVLGVESYIRQYADHYPISGAGYCDYSFGISQITVCTLHGTFGVGDGSLSRANIAYVRSWEDNLHNAIWASAALLRQFQNATCLPFPYLYVAYNAGPGYGCGAYFYYHPTGLAWSNFQNYLGWWNYVNAVYATPDHQVAPRPRPVWHFPTKRWCRWDRAHHRRCVAHTWRHHIAKVAWVWARWHSAFHGHRSLDHACGGVESAERWFPRLKMEKQAFAHCVAFSWPRFRGDPVKWVRTRRHPSHVAPTADVGATQTASKSTIPANWWLTATDAPRAWSITRGAGVTICDVDSGFDPASADLAPAVVGEKDFVDATPSIADVVGHGTMTSSIALGRGVTTTGVAPQANLLVAKVFADEGTGTPIVVSAMRWCVDSGASVINASFGGGWDQTIADAVTYACAHNVAIAAAAGNAGPFALIGSAHMVVFPAAVPSPCLVAVGASDPHSRFASFSDWNTNAREVTAPGEHITADRVGGGTHTGSGTSFSTPMAAGALALERAEGASARQAVSDLLQTARLWHKYTPRQRFGYGEIDVYKAVKLVIAQRANHPQAGL